MSLANSFTLPPVVPQYADVITYHGYVYQVWLYRLPDRCRRVADHQYGVRAVMADLRPVRQASMGHGDELGTVTAASCFYNQDLQAAFLAQLFMLHWSAGVERVFLVSGTTTSKMGDALDSNSHHRNLPGTLHEAGVAYEQVYKWLGGVTMDGRLQRLANHLDVQF